MACKSIDAIVNLQKDNLISAINESYVAESKRVERLAMAKSAKERNWLCRRYEVERQADMHRIDNLKLDYDALNKKIASGEFELRGSRPTSGKTAAELVNVQSRFHGLDTAEEIRFFRGLWGGIEKKDQVVQERMARQVAGREKKASLQIHKESEKLKLLNERKDVLTQLISIQRQCQHETGGVSSRQCASRLSSRESASWDTTGRPSTSSSQASSASFTVANLHLHNKLLSRPSCVPKLNLQQVHS